MTKNVQLSEVQLVNLSALLAIRDGIKRDPTSTCCQFGIGADETTFFMELLTDRIYGIVASIGHECLFPPRPDLLSLLRLPLPLTSPIAAAHPPHKTMPHAMPARAEYSAHR
jgi:hypothetical protein